MCTRGGTAIARPCTDIVSMLGIYRCRRQCTPGCTVRTSTLNVHTGWHCNRTPVHWHCVNVRDIPISPVVHSRWHSEHIDAESIALAKRHLTWAQSRLMAHRSHLSSPGRHRDGEICTEGSTSITSASSQSSCHYRYQSAAGARACHYCPHRTLNPDLYCPVASSLDSI